MDRAKLFVNGRSQAVRLPKAYRFKDKEVYVKKIGNIVLLIPKDDPWSSLVSSVHDFTEDYMGKRKQPPLPERESLE